MNGIEPSALGLTDLGPEPGIPSRLQSLAGWFQ